MAEELSPNQPTNQSFTDPEGAGDLRNGQQFTVDGHISSGGDVTGCLRSATPECHRDRAGITVDEIGEPGQALTACAGSVLRA